jgi:hypothetical protein
MGIFDWIFRRQVKKGEESVDPEEIGDVGENAT